MKAFLTAFMVLIISMIYGYELRGAWGFFGHKKINQIAIFTLPTELLPFYRHHLEYITENAVNPDRRRYAVKYEAPRHYIDLDVYGDSLKYNLPLYWKAACEQFTEDSLMNYGIVPWHIYRVKNQLTDAFFLGDVPSILRLSADLGHYIADANVPLHTTENYNGQLTGQHGIHGFWESRLPELFFDDYMLFTGPAKYVSNTQKRAWEAVFQAHVAKDSVLDIERNLNNQFDSDQKYTFEERGTQVVRTYSRRYAEQYHRLLHGMVERQMKSAIAMVGDFWYTAWVDAGQPDLNKLLTYEFTEEQLEERRKLLELWKQEKFQSRNHEHSLN